MSRDRAKPTQNPTISLAEPIEIGNRNNEEARSYISRFNDVDYFHIRTHYEDREGVMQPGKGFACDAEFARDIIKFLRETADSLEKWYEG